VITGASRGIGRAIALALAGAGAGVCLIARGTADLEEVAEAARRTGAPTVLSYTCDIGEPESATEIAARLRRDGFPPDVLVHSAGVHHRGTMADASVEDMDDHLRLNVRAPYALTKALLPELLAGRGEVVFVNSSQGLTVRAEVGQYAASKHALRALADALREEVNPHGVRVLSVFPGRTATPGQLKIFEDEGRPWRPEVLIQPEDVAAVVLAAVTLPRTAEVTEIRLRSLVKWDEATSTSSL
jgi:short-subunit dehydrogenase